TMIVAGDIRFGEALQLARRFLEPIPPHAPPPPVTTKEPEQLGERRVKVVKFAQLPILMVGFHVHESAHEDFFALQMLRTILLYGQSSRLYQRLVDKDQLAVEVSGNMDLALDPTLFTVVIQPREGIATDLIEKALYEELDRLKSGPLSDHELQKAKNALLANFYRERKTINSKAQSLGNYEVFFGDYRKLFTAGDQYLRVTADDVQRVTKKYFLEKNRTVAALVPEKEQSETKP